jgi:hypothetical protein
MARKDRISANQANRNYVTHELDALVGNDTRCALFYWISVCPHSHVSDYSILATTSELRACIMDHLSYCHLLSQSAAQHLLRYGMCGCIQGLRR